jgi:FAD/FMN-containing dehydrogenase
VTAVTSVDGERVSVDNSALAELASHLQGSVLRPGDRGFADAIYIWNAMVQRTPAFVIQPETPGDVAAAVSFARERRLLLSVKGGGHHIAGTSLAPGGITLDMSRMREVSVDPKRRLARAGAGCLLRDVDAATQLHGLAAVLGFISDTGIAGLTLGGGFGYLSRRFGWAADNLEEVEIVTADGTIRRASRDENDDLFWAVRGAGANLGVVTSFTYRLHEVGPMVYGGLIAWPFDRAQDVLGVYRDVTASAPRELTAFLINMRAPAAPFVPAPWRGEWVCAMPICYSGDPAHAEGAIAPLRALGRPVFDLLQTQPYAQLQAHLDETEPFGRHYYWKTEYASELSDGLLYTMRALAAACPIPGGQLVFIHLGGAIGDREEDDGAVGNRDVKYAYGAAGMWEPDDPRGAQFRDWVRAAGNALSAYSTGRHYVNFETADESVARTAAAYGENFARLAQMKAKYDPGNLFRSNRNIRPYGA